MGIQVSFIDRESEMEQIGNAINAWGTPAMIYIRAEGGTGKTRLLQEVRTHYQRWDKALLLDKVDRDSIKIAVVNEFTHSEWSNRFLNGAAGLASDLGVELLQLDANFDIEKMGQDLDGLIQSEVRPNAIVVRLGTDEKLRPSIERAIRSGIPILTVDNYLPRLDGVISITTDEHQGAYRSSQQLAKEIGSSGKVVAMLVKNVPMQERRQAMLSDLLGQFSNNIELIQEWLPMGTNMSQIAYEHTQTVLASYPDLRCIWVTWDEFGRGVVKALRDSGRTDIGVYSFDLLSDEDVDLMLTEGSVWRATVTIDPAIVGRAAIQLAIQAACKKTLDKHYSIPMQFVDQELLRKRRENWWSIWEEYDVELMPRLLLPEIIDFDDYTFRDEQSFQLKVVDLLGEQHFKPFFSELRYLNELKMIRGGQDIIARHEADVERAFIDCLKKVTEKQRLVLLIDTAEKSRDVLHFILSMVSAANNIVTIFAGRPDDITDQFLDPLTSRIQIINLPRLEMEASEMYMQEKQRLLKVKLEPDLARKLLHWTAGKPILIDLAIEWRARKDPMDWLVKTSLEQLEKMSPARRQKLGTEFEGKLVSHIAQTRTSLDLLILFLAQVYPLNNRLIHELLNISKEEAQDLLTEVQSYVFIKNLPNERITLHDEMRRLINTYAWPEVDPDDEWRLEISRSAVRYLDKQIHDCMQKIDELKNSQTLQSTGGRESTDVRRWRDLQTRTEELWMLRENLLRHTLITDMEAGFKLFLMMFDEATSTYRYTPRLDWIHMVEGLLESMSKNQTYEFYIRKAKTLLDLGNYKESEQILRKVKAVKPEQEIELAIQSANILIRKGDFSGGIRSFAKAVKLSRSAIAHEEECIANGSSTAPGYLNELKRWLVKAENGLGWAHRLTANLEAARKHYESALALAIELDLQHEQAMLYNNLGFLLSYLKDVPQHNQVALRFCTESLRLATLENDRRSIGRAYSALGCVHFMAGDISEAFESFQNALDIFEPTHDEEWLSVVYAWRGVAHISSSTPDLARAEEDILRAKAIDLPKERPMVRSRLSLIYLLQNKLTEAGQMAEECYESAQQLPDVWYQWIAIRDLARLARFQKRYDRLGELEEKMNEYLKHHAKPDDRAGGMLHLELGNLALGQNLDEQACQHYFQGMKTLAGLGKYGNDDPTTYLERLEEEVLIENLNVEPARLRKIGKYLLEHWQNENLHIHFPDVRAFLLRWATWEEGKV